MTRPHIIRADTLDLQDKSSPTAQDHTRQPQHPAPLGIGPPAPHQEASLRHVTEERIEEEVNLQNSTWSDSNTLREDPGSDDERTVVNGLQQDETAVRLNGGMTGDGDDGEMQDADEEDTDDDMMDKISSSPSIDDGGSLPSYHESWLERSSSLTPASSPFQSPIASPSTCVDSSSPFTTTPIHFPISAAPARRPHGVPADSVGSISKSPYLSSPLPFSLPPSQNSHLNQSAEHHRGEYTWSRSTQRSPADLEPDGDSKINPIAEHMTLVERRLQSMRLDSEMSLSSELDEEDFRTMLQPVPSPLREEMDVMFSDSEITKDAHTPELNRENGSHASHKSRPVSQSGPDEDDDSWTTDSDADSWDEDLDKYDDDSEGFSFSEDSRFIDSGWGGECLRETEDIDFEFVYALHTFVATVEGQANATKGDTMVLLDDSNSYWWLVRVVKDSSIGYLPAEHIETPTERLARLNKHRNIDLSATMLGDTAEKTKNPLKKAMRRRNAKTVQFAPPTYVEASEYEYSSDEDGDGDLFGGADPTQVQAQAATEKAEPERDGDLQVQPLNVNGVKRDPEGTAEADGRGSTEDSIRTAVDAERASDEMFDRPLDPKVSRNGTMRNTDSFFKDENTETRKITLTPNLLRDDSSTSTTGSRERGPSLESLEKNGFADKVKDEKKKKEKKPGMLSGLFKRKDKKTKGSGLDSVDSDVEKQSEEFGRSSPQSKLSDEFSPERTSTEQSPQRNTSKGKLQKPQRGREESSAKINVTPKSDSPERTVTQTKPQDEAPSNKSAPQANATMRMVSPERDDQTVITIEERALSPESGSRSTSAAAKLNPMNMLKSQGNTDDPRPEKVKKAKRRVQLDDFDSEEDEVDPFADPGSHAPTARSVQAEPVGRLSESPVHVSVADAEAPGKDKVHKQDQEPDPQQPPGLTGDSSSQETTSPISTPTPDDSPSTSEPHKPSLAASRPDASPSPTLLTTNPIPPPSRPAPVPAFNTAKEVDPSPPVSSESTSLPAWSDSALRTYLDDGSDIRDMLMVINDTTGVVPVGPDHPIMAQLFVEESKRVTGLSGELDALLNNLLDKRMKRSKNGVFPKPLR
ncbi:hypothetical protein BDV95DRAFT_605286 [Massariosphaeria phaeospora]|uniref:SH3 domain-containing protein n=1 Tax=Massariosphaeria phaeospora TaxID=100035 RepID=A0A7C8IGQ5_9PLEO|nr:hypothetical protein BDV95DRAFT_605286 [Massariosphaeria phaeospora]